ncbi:HAD family hydrolase [Bradyrhizobium sp. Ai1a-2]|uniref:HAD family hydrolase n=1 Tax=Bradyrhizobium sp. Ai1a-2 TaxID=196490 RepID=UPI00041BE004|nr:HAD family hydrolase [Bradyrhizobium sp. Ai1a-2]
MLKFEIRSFRAHGFLMVRRLACSLTLLTFIGVVSAQAQTDSLPSWNDGAAKTAVKSFIADVTTPGNAKFVPPEDRVAVFDNDGTLLAEMPNINLAFALDEVRRLSGAHPEWRTNEPFKAILDNARAYLSKLSRDDTVSLALAAFAGTDEKTFEQTASAWLQTASNPTLHRPYQSLVYQPQLELLQLLRANGFKVYLVSGGEVDFLRSFANAEYGIPPEQVIGSSVRYDYKVVDGQPTIERVAQLGSLNDGPGNVANIQLHIGKRPILAFGNSDGDEPMLAMTAANDKPHLVLILHHDDAEREFAYDRAGPSWGRLDKLWDEANERHWQIVSMKNDFRLIFPPLTKANESK